MNVYSKTGKSLRGLGAALIAGGLLLACSSARADIKYSKITKMGDGDDQKVMSRITTYVKEGFERTETTTDIGPAKMTDVALTFCDKQQNVRIIPTLKIYTISSRNGSSSSSNSKSGSKANGDANKNEGKKTGKIVMTTTVKDLGEETIAGFKTRHYMITSQMQMSGCAGDGQTNTKMEIWVADIQDANPCKDTSAADYSGMGGGGASNCDITFEQKGDVDAYTKAYRGLIMRMKMYNGDKVMMVQEVTMLSQAKLDDTPFTIPADYQEVSAEEFQKKQSEAMMQAIMKQSQNGGNDQNANDDDNKDDGNKDDANKDDANKDDNNGEANGNGNGNGNDDKKDEDKGEEEPARKPKKKRGLGGFKLPF